MHKITPYFELIRNKNKLLSIQINITNRCFSRCKSCRKYEWPNHTLTVSEIVQICELAKKEGCESFVISGGEPFAHPDILDILQKVSTYGEVGLITSGILPKELCTNESYEVIATRCKWIQVSIDSVHVARFKEIRGVNALIEVEKFIRNIQSLRKQKQKRPIKINTVASKLNYFEIENILKFAFGNGCEVGIYPVHTWPEMELSDSEFDEVRRICSQYDVNFERQGGLPPICIIPEIHLVVDADGYVYPCCRLLNDNGEYDETRKFSYGHFEEISNYIGHAQRFFFAPHNIALCESCDRYRIINTEYFAYCTTRESIFL